MGSKSTTVIIEAPVGSYSFFGEKSRELIDTIREIHPGWNVKIMNYQEERTRAGHPGCDGVEVIEGVTTAPDIWIQVGHPGRFRRMGKQNIGVVCVLDYHPIQEFVDGCGQMDLLLTYSLFSKQFITESLNIKTPVVVLPEYMSIPDQDPAFSPILKDVSTSWNYIIDGYWDVVDSPEFGGKNTYNINFLVNIFLRTFVYQQDTGLILCVHGDLASEGDRLRILNRINKIIEETGYDRAILPKIYVVNDNLTPEQRSSIYNDPVVKAMISIRQRSDSASTELGFALTSGKPIIFSNYAAQHEYLNYDGNIALGGGLKQADGGRGPMQVIDTPMNDVKIALYEMRYHYDDYITRSTTSSQELFNRWSREKFIEVLNKCL